MRTGGEGRPYGPLPLPDLTGTMNAKQEIEQGMHDRPGGAGIRKEKEDMNNGR